MTNIRFFIHALSRITIGLLAIQSSAIHSAESSFEIDGLSAEVGYVADLFSNRSGGIEKDTRYLQNLDLTASLDLDAITGNNLGEVFFYVLYNDGSTFSDAVGDLQGASNIDADQGWRFYEAWWDLPVGENLSIKTGLFDLNSEFDAIDTAGYFINSSQGIGADYAQSGENGPSIFPSASAAIRFAWVKESMVFRYALLDAVPGDPDDPNRFFSLELGDGEGVLHALELENTFDNGLRAALGYWRYSSAFDKINDFSGGEPVREKGNQGLYAFVDAPIYQSENGIWVNAFARYGQANEEVNQLSNYLGFGAVSGGLLKSRPDDVFGLAVAIARNGSEFKQLNDGAVDDQEIAIELTYSTQINERLRIQPDIQYIINPGTDPSLDNALVLGVRFELGWGF